MTQKTPFGSGLSRFATVNTPHPLLLVMEVSAPARGVVRSLNVVAWAPQPRLTLAEVRDAERTITADLNRAGGQPLAVALTNVIELAA